MDPTPEPAAPLADSESGFRAVADAVIDAIVAADERGVIVFCNRAATRMFGRSAEELLEQPLTILMPERFRDAHEAGFARVLGGGHSDLVGRATVELEAERADGSEFPIELSLGAFAEGGARRFTGVIRDITERREAERVALAEQAVSTVLAEADDLESGVPRLLAAVCESMGWSAGGVWQPSADDDRLHNVAVWTSDVERLEAFARATRKTTLGPGEGLPGRVWASRAPVWATDVTADPGFIRRVEAVEGCLKAGFAMPITTGGTLHGVVEFFAETPQPDDAAGRRAIEGLGDRIGQFFQRKLAEQRLAETAADLERSNRDLEQFAYVASHDLSEPLRTIGGFSGLLQRRYEGQLDAGADEWLSFIAKGTQRMQALIDDLLAYARVGSKPPAAEPVDLEALLGRTVESLAAQVQESGGTVQVDDLPRVRGDAGLLAQLLQNLVGNALKFRGDAPPRVTVSAARSGRRVVIAVADNGIGIEPELADKVFQMFSRLHARDEYAGTGIGLALCQRIVERHGGHIWHEPNPGGGSIFRFDLPL